MTKVFISYSHEPENEHHKQRVLDLSNRLRTDGIDCDIDQYNPAPEQGWPRWMMQGIQQADYVLLVCTETYRKRLELEEEQGKGLGVKWEGSLIFNILYRNETFNRKFIPLVFDTENKAYIPDILFGYDYHDLSQPRGYDNLYRHIRGELGAEKPPLGKPHYTRTIYSNSLPTVEGKLFGRKDELALLDKAWADPQTHVVQFVASGGTGKTKLLKHWLDTNTDSIEALIAWSFYSQGSSEDKQVSATPFFSHVFGVLKSEKTQFSTEEEKGEHLAHLLRQRRCMLVLDGLEPLQYAGRGMRGELKDRAIRQLLKSLAGKHNSLCIITTRLAVHELSDRAHAISHNLQNLAPEDGVNLLKSIGVHGGESYQSEYEQLSDAVNEYGCHALALHLLGHAIRLYMDGNVLLRYKIDDLMEDREDERISRHAFKVMRAYANWLSGTSELRLLYLLSLFDHPIDQKILQILWQAEIPNLTSEVSQREWQRAHAALLEHHKLLFVHENNSKLFDCHPLIREYFGQQLEKQFPDAWQQAHARLYEYYKALPEKELPDTLEEMQPLFSAVSHGCSAGLYQKTWDDVYWKRIQRSDQYYLLYQLGNVSDDLALIANFFSLLWGQAAIELTPGCVSEALAIASYDLYSLGRLRESVEPMLLSINGFITQENWIEAAVTSSNLSEQLLIGGDIEQSLIYASNSIKYAIKSEDKFHIVAFYTTLADALHQTGNLSEASKIFRKAELIHKSRQTSYQYLNLMAGFRYCNFLLDTQEFPSVITRAKDSLSYVLNGSKNKLAIALDRLSVGRAYVQFALSDNQESHLFLDALEWVDQSVIDLRTAQAKDHLPRGLLARAALHRHTRDFARARQDLQEVFDIAEPSGMRLHLTDYHLEMARLLLAEEENPPQSPFCKGGSQEAAGSAVPLFEKGG